MTASNSFAALMQRLDAGDAEAAALIYDRYARRLIGLAQHNLSKRLQAKVGCDDVVQSVFRTFFRRLKDKPFDLTSEGALWALLAQITLRKCGRWNRHFAALKRGGEVPATPLLDEPDEEPADSREPSPADAVLLVDLIDQLLRGLDDRSRLICELQLQGHTPPEIAERTGSSLSTVYRKLDLIKRRLSQLCPAEVE